MPNAADTSKKTDDKTLQNIFSIEFSKKAYTFTLAEVARGIRIDYTISVKRDIDGAIPHQQDVGSASGPGTSGLYPFEVISGNGQSYSLRDVGLGPPHELPARKLEKGVYPIAFEWDGRNWTGPSDFDPPKGDPFPPSSYTLTVRIVGEVETAGGKKSYDVANSVEVRLTP